MGIYEVLNLVHGPVVLALRNTRSPRTSGWEQLFYTQKDKFIGDSKEGPTQDVQKGFHCPTKILEVAIATPESPVTGVRQQTHERKK